MLDVVKVLHVEQKTLLEYTEQMNIHSILEENRGMFHVEHDKKDK